MTTVRWQPIAITVAAVALLALIWQQCSQPPPAPVVVTPSPTLPITVLPSTPLPTVAPTATAVVVPERVLTTPSRTPIPPLLVLPPTDTPTVEPTAMPNLTLTPVTQRG